MNVKLNMSLRKHFNMPKKFKKKAKKLKRKIKVYFIILFQIKTLINITKNNCVYKTFNRKQKTLKLMLY